MHTEMRNKIRIALSERALTASKVCAITGLESKAVSTALSAMRHRTKEVSYIKTAGESFGVYKLLPTAKKPAQTKPMLAKNVELKISQLENNQDLLRLKGVSLIDEIIDDYRAMLA